MNETFAFTETDVVQMRVRVHNAFKAKDLSIKAAERECGVAVGTFQKFIAGETDIIGAGNLARIAALTGVSADTFLFGERPSLAGLSHGPVTGGTVRMIAHSAIQPSALNPRKRGFDPESLQTLAQSIEAHGGLMQNLVVRPIDPDASESGPFEIVAGERRWRAYALLIANGAVPDTVALPCAVRILTDDDAMELMLVENMERQDLSPMEEGRAFLELWNRRRQAFGARKAGDVVKHLAARLNRSDRFIQKRIRLARDLVPEAQAALEEGKILLAHAEVLATAPKDTQRAQAGLLTALPLEAQPTARAIGQAIANDLPDLSLAVFKRKDYDAGVFEFDGKDYAVDIPFFARLQDKAIEAKRAEYTKLQKSGDLAFVDEGVAFKASHYVEIEATPMVTGGVFIEVQDKGAWRVARFIERLDRAGNVTPATLANQTEPGDEDDEGDLLVPDERGDASPPAGKSRPQRIFDPAAAERQFGPLRAAFENRVDLCAAIVVFDDVMFGVGDFGENARLRIGPNCGFRWDPARTERMVAKLGLTLPGENDDGEAFAAQLLDKLLRAPEGQILRFMAEILADAMGCGRPLELNALERRVFQAAGLDPDAAGDVAKEAA